MAGERYRHIFLPGPTQTQRFTSPRKGGGDRRIPDRDRGRHSEWLRQRLQQAWLEVEGQCAVYRADRDGGYLEFVGEPGFDLIFQSLEARRSGIRLLNVREEQVDGQKRILATLYVPNNKRQLILNKITAYANELNHRGDNPKNADLINSISDIRRAVLESFWPADERQLIPTDEPGAVEVWLSSDRDEIREGFEQLLATIGIEPGEGTLKFPERLVKLIRANREQLERLLESSDSIAEFRLAREVASYYIELENREQIEQVRNLLARTTYTKNTDVAVCILDTGVNYGHLLITPVLNDNDRHTVLAAWGTHDDKGHGTMMAGLATYGDLLELLQSAGPVRIGHRLESAKILPPVGQNRKEFWGYITTKGIKLAEAQAPNRKRIICMAVTSTEDRDRGRPTSWSAALDALTSGANDDFRRLIVVSAGNVEGSDYWCNYPTANLTDEVNDPAQAWNVLTAGAFTEKTRITDPTLAGFAAIAPAGGLSPFSTTSCSWPGRKWPIKPEVVFEGGNVARGPNKSIVETEDLKLLSTSHEPTVAQFVPVGATSAAAAQAAWLAAQIQTQYPDAWPETVRAMIVHTAEWTDTLKAQVLRAQPTKTNYAKLLRVCGYGVPDLDRALYCAANSLTLIAQTELQPFDKHKGRYVTRDMHLYNLPWPTEILAELAETQVTMRVTLSFFVEPGPGEIGWENRYRYASHALRFDVNGPAESESEFIRRINMQARDDSEHPGTAGAQDRWTIGEGRNVGSVHSDIWSGSAIELAQSNHIAVYPVVGWWRERHHLKRWNKTARYSLIVSIYTREAEIDIYTPVAIKVGVKVPITIRTDRKGPA